MILWEFLVQKNKKSNSAAMDYSNGWVFHHVWIYRNMFLSSIMLCKKSRTNLDYPLTFYTHNFLRSISHKKHTAWLVDWGLKNSVHYRPEKVTLGGFQIKIDCRHLFDSACLCLSAALKTFCANVKKKLLGICPTLCNIKRVSAGF